MLSEWQGTALAEPINGVKLCSWILLHTLRGTESRGYSPEAPWGRRGEGEGVGEGEGRGRGDGEGERKGVSM